MHILLLTLQHSSGIQDGRVVKAQKVKGAVNREAGDFIRNGYSVFAGLLSRTIDIQVNLSFQPGPGLKEKADDIGAVIMPKKLSVQPPATPGIHDHHGHFRPSDPFPPKNCAHGLAYRQPPDLPRAMGVHNRDRKNWSGVHRFSSVCRARRGVGSLPGGGNGGRERPPVYRTPLFFFAFS